MEPKKWYQKLGDWIKCQVKKVIDFSKKVYDQVAKWLDRNKGSALEFLAKVTAACTAFNVLRNKFTRSAYGFSKNRIYDPRYGHYWPLKRKPTPEEYDLIHRRYRTGDEYYDILRDMKLLREGSMW